MAHKCSLIGSLSDQSLIQNITWKKFIDLEDCEENFTTYCERTITLDAKRINEDLEKGIQCSRK